MTIETMKNVAPGGVVHLWEHRDALLTIGRLQKDNARLRKYATYLSMRMQAQAMVINEKIDPVVAASILDDLEDAASIAGIEPREWKQ